MNDKPIIRHCKNCKYSESATLFDAYCNVKYDYVDNGRIGAIFCPYYKAKNSGRRMKYKFYRRDVEMYKNDICILPTIRVFINNMIYTEKNFSIEFHCFTLHARLLWLREDGD